MSCSRLCLLWSNARWASGCEATYVSLAAGQEQASVVVRGALVGLATYLEKRIALVAKQSGEAMN